MRRSLPPLNALLAFEAAARHNNFTHAASELSVAQPAVTRHIAKLEDWVGAPLFLRRGSAIELTAEGRVLADLATSVLDRLELGMRDVARSGADELVIGASFGIAHLWVMPRIGRMREASGTAINFLTSDDYRVLDSASVDFSIRFGDGNFGQNAADLLFEERCQIIVSPSFLEKHPEFDETDPARSLKKELVLDHGDPYGAGWVTWTDWYSETGLPFPGRRYLTTVHSYPAMLDMVCAGEGVGIGSHGLEDHLVESGKLVRVGPQIARRGYGYYLVYRRELEDKPAFRKLRALLIGQTESESIQS